MDCKGFWRRRWDSNPRYALTAYNGLANRRLQPLGHPSAAGPGTPDRDKAHKGCKREGKASLPSPRRQQIGSGLISPRDEPINYLILIGFLKPRPQRRRAPKFFPASS